MALGRQGIPSLDGVAAGERTKRATKMRAGPCDCAGIMIGAGVRAVGHDRQKPPHPII
jgi:hypothetical protein